MSWLVSLLNEEIKGFIVQGPILIFLFLHDTADPILSNYLLYSIHYSSSRRLFFPSGANTGNVFRRSLSISDPILVSLSPNSSLTLREYVAGVSDNGLYLLNSGFR